MLLFSRSATRRGTRVPRVLALVLAMLMVLAAAPPVAAADAEWGEATEIGRFPFSEASGLVASRTHEGIVWIMRDSGQGDRTRLYAMRIDASGSLVPFPDGSRFRDIDVTGEPNTDWEDLAIDDAGNLWVGDIGNNSCTRAGRQLLRIPEPDPYTATTVAVDAVFPISWPDAPQGCTGRNAESLFFIGSSAYIINKAERSWVYRVPLERGADNRLVRLAEMRSPSASGRFEFLTGADVSRDGTRLVLTARGIGAWVFDAEPGGSTDDLVIRLAADDATKVEGRGANEGIALLPADHSIVLVSETGPITLAAGPGAGSGGAPPPAQPQPAPQPSEPDEATPVDSSLSGSASEEKGAWQRVPIEILADGQLDARLSWVGDADMNLFLRDPSDTPVAHSNDVEAEEERISHPVTPGVWSLFVHVRSGESTFDLQVTAPQSEVPLGSAQGGTRPGATPGSSPVSRLSGADRVATGVELSRTTFSPDSVDVAVIARADDFPDALAAGQLAGAHAGPLLLTPTASLDAGVAAELQRLGVQRVVVVGGPGAVSEAVVAQLRSVPGVADVTRLMGAERFGTAAVVAEATVEALTASGRAPSQALVTLGSHPDPSRAWPDALAASQLAIRGGDVMLLTAPDGLPDSSRAVLDSLGVDTVTLVGGTSAIPPSVADGLADDGWTVDRIAGASRDATSVLLARAAVEVGATLDHVLVVSGGSYADALTAGPAAAALGGVMVLAQTDTLGAASSWLQQQRDDVGFLRIVGGTSAVSPAVEAELQAILS